MKYIRRIQRNTHTYTHTHTEHVMILYEAFCHYTVFCVSVGDLCVKLFLPNILIFFLKGRSMETFFVPYLSSTRDKICCFCKK